MGSYYQDKSKYEKEKRDAELAQVILKTAITVAGVILTFIFLKILAPIASKHPIASLVVILALGIGGYFFFSAEKSSNETKVEKINDYTKESDVIENSSIPTKISLDKGFINIEGFNIYIPKGFVIHHKMQNTYVLSRDSGDLMYFSYEFLSTPKGPWDLNPNACEADYTGSADELYVSEERENEMSTIWREYKKGDKWCLLSVWYDNENSRSSIYDFLAKSH